MTAKRKTKPVKAKSDSREKTGKTPLDPSRPIGKNNPPIETQFQRGAPSPNPHGRPRKLRDLQELIKDVMAENITPDVTRITAAIKIGLNKHPTVWLEYAFGKVPQPTHEMNRDEWREWLKENGYSDTDIESLADQFASFIRDRRIGAASVSTDDSKPDVQ